MYEKNKRGWFKHLDFVIADIVALQISYVLAYIMRHGLGDIRAGKTYLQMGVVLIFVDICVMFFTETYSGILRRSDSDEIKETIKHVSIIVVIAFMYIFFTKTGDVFSRAVFIYLWWVSLLLVFTTRQILKVVVKKRIKKKKEYRSVILISTQASAEESIRIARRKGYQDYTFTAAFLIDLPKERKDVLDIPIKGDLSQVLTYLQKEVIDEVFINLPREYEVPKKIIEACVDMGITVHFNLMRIEQGEHNIIIEEFAGHMVLSTSIKMATSKQMVLKRLMDIGGSIVGIFLTLIATIVVGPMIYIKSPGPIFFSQIRVGKHGRKFRLYKFRSMYMDAEARKAELMEQNEMQGLMFKINRDPRIIKGIGEKIRAWSIDELPQFFNVLKGDMSLVGTRPPTVEEYEQYELHHKRRLAIKPGITGLWQISGRNNISDFEEVVALDTEYITNWTLGLDVKILLNTVLVVLLRKGSS